MTNPAMEAVKAEVRRSSTAVFAYISEFETHDLHSMKIFIDGELASRLVPALEVVGPSNLDPNPNDWRIIAEHVGMPMDRVGPFFAVAAMCGYEWSRNGSSCYGDGYIQGRKDEALDRNNHGSVAPPPLTEGLESAIRRADNNADQMKTDAVKFNGIIDTLERDLLQEQRRSAALQDELNAAPPLTEGDRWVDCKQELPQEGDDVWVVMDGVTQTMPYFWEGGQWIPNDESDHAPEGTFSHWMPYVIPAPPKLTASPDLERCFRCVEGLHHQCLDAGCKCNCPKLESPKTKADLEVEGDK